MCVHQSLMVAKAKDELEQELAEKEVEKERYLAEKAPPLQTGGMSFAELQVCPQLIKLSYTTCINIDIYPLQEVPWFYQKI